MKHRFIPLVVVCLSIMLLPVCAPQPEEEAEPMEQEVLSTEADVAAIKSVVTDKWAAAMSAEDVDALMALYSDEAVSMDPGEPSHVGHQAIRAKFERDLGNNAFEIVSTVDDVVVSGDYAVIRGSDNDTLSPKDGGEPSNLNSKWMILTQRQPDGTWKILWEIWNRNTPPPPAAQTDG